MTNESEPNGAPRIFSHYELQTLLGEGGMGAVYRGIDRRDGTPVAIKLLHAKLASDPSFRERFEREAHVAALLRSPYTVHLVDYGFANGQFFLVMEYIDGQSVGQAITHGGLPIEQALKITADAARALEEAQARGVVHRDIKPDNILISADGTAKVADFGIARQESGATLTTPGGFVGTMAYASPEHLTGTTDHRSDIYSLGAALYHMVAGRPPYRGTMLELLSQVQSAPIPMEPLAALPATVRDILARSMAKDPAERFQNANQMARALDLAARELASGSTAETVIQPAPVETVITPTPVSQVPTIAPNAAAGATRVPSSATSSSGKMSLNLTESKRSRFGGSANYELVVRSNSTEWSELHLQPTGLDPAVRVVAPATAAVPPLGQLSIPVEVKPAARRLRGQTRKNPFAISASGGGGNEAPVTVGGEFEDRPASWLLYGGSFFGISIVAAVVAALVLFTGGNNGKASDGYDNEYATNTPSSRATPTAEATLPATNTPRASATTEASVTAQPSQAATSAPTSAATSQPVVPTQAPAAPTPTATPPPPTPTPSSPRLRSFAVGEWSYDYYLTANTCGADPDQYYFAATQVLEEVNGSDGYISDGESVRIYDFNGGASLGTMTFTWPTLSYQVGLNQPNGVRMEVTHTYFDAHSGKSRVVEVYSDGYATCEMTFEE